MATILAGHRTAPSHGIVDVRTKPPWAVANMVQHLSPMALASLGIAPACRASRRMVAPEEPCAVFSRSRGGLLSLPTLLMVDNNLGDLELVAMACEEAQLPVRWERAMDGQQGQDALRQILAGTRPAPDLMILDLNMPRMSGREVLTWARAQPGLQALPIVILTSSDAPNDRQTCLAAGANDVLTKPLTFDAYIDLVGQFRRYLPASPPPL